MKITKSTIDILRNYSGINQNILIHEGNKLVTRNVAKSIFVDAVVDTTFPKEFGIYNLTSFLGVLSLFSEPEVDLNDDHLVIYQGKNKVRYMFAEPDVLDYPDKMYGLPQVDAEFVLTEENLKSILKSGAILSSTDLKISGDGSVITCVAMDEKNPLANTFSVEVGTTDRTFDAYIKLENLKMPVGSYNVRMSSKYRTKFSHTGYDYNFLVLNTTKTKWVDV